MSTWFCKKPYGLGSLRRAAEEVRTNIYYRRHRFTSSTVHQIFNWILTEMAEAGYVAPGIVFVDGTHIKANANTKKVVQKVRKVEMEGFSLQLLFPCYFRSFPSICSKPLSCLMQSRGFSTV